MAKTSWARNMKKQLESESHYIYQDSNVTAYFDSGNDLIPRKFGSGSPRTKVTQVISTPNGFVRPK